MTSVLPDHRFQLIRGLATTPVGRVFEAIDTASGHHVAVTVYDGRSADDNVRLTRLRDNLLALCALDHPNIARIFGVFNERDATYIVSEFVAGVSLSEILRSEHPSPDRLRSLFVQVAGALDYAHRAGRAHGALRPSAIIVTPSDRAKIIDFGVSSLLRAPRERLNSSDRMYIRPDLGPGDQSGPDADLYALGVMMYQAVCGVVAGAPNEGEEDPVAATFEHFIRMGVAPSEVNPNVSADWNSLIFSLISPTPDHPAVDAGTIAQQLREIRATAAAEPIPISAGLRSLDRSSDATMVLPRVIELPQPPDVPVDPHFDPPPPDNRRKLIAIAAALAAAAIVIGGGLWLLGRGNKTAQAGGGTVSDAAPTSLLPQRSVSYPSGTKVDLAWYPTPRASRYNIQIIATDTAWTQPEYVWHPTSTATTTDSHFRYLAYGPSYYYWRVQAFVHGAWQPFSDPHVFTVSAPTVGVAHLSWPHNWTRWLTSSAHLCWQAAPHATSYYLNVSGHPTQKVAATCEWVGVSPGTFGWRVAAVVRGTHDVVGSWTPWWHFTILAPPKPKPAPKPPAAVSQPPAVAAAPTPATVAQAPSYPSAAQSPPVQSSAPVQQAPAASAPAPRPAQSAPSTQSSSSSKPNCIAFVNC